MTRRVVGTRAVSTVVDVSVCLLLVSAAVVTLALATPTPTHEEPNRARQTAAVLGASTATVEYRPIGPLRSEWEAAGNRTAHGTLAGLLAEAALLDARRDGDGLRWSDDRPEMGFVAAIRSEVRAALRPVDAEVQVVATWRPFPDSTVRGRVVVGESPSRAVTVDAATVTVPVGPGDAAERVRRAGRAARTADAAGGSAAREVAPAARAVALARATLAVLFGPPVAGRDGHPSPRTAAAYRRFAAAYGLAVPTGDDRDLRVELLDALAGRYRTELPAGNAPTRRPAVGRVTITVRTWSA